MPKFRVTIRTVEVFDAEIDAADEATARADAMILWPEQGQSLFQSSQYDWDLNDVEAIEFDNEQAGTEGWGIFSCDGSRNGPYQVQRDDEAAVFEDDDALHAFLKGKVSEGSEYHRSALEFLQVYNPIEHAAIMEGPEAARQAAALYWAEHDETEGAADGE